MSSVGTNWVFSAFWVSLLNPKMQAWPSSSLSWVYHLLSNRVYCFHLRAWDHAWNSGRYKGLYGGNTPVIQPVRFQDMFNNFSATSIVIFIFNDTKNILSEIPRKVCKKAIFFLRSRLVMDQFLVLAAEVNWLWSRNYIHQQGACAFKRSWTLLLQVWRDDKITSLNWSVFSFRSNFIGPAHTFHSFFTSKFEIRDQIMGISYRAPDSKMVNSLTVSKIGRLLWPLCLRFRVFRPSTEASFYRSPYMRNILTEENKLIWLSLSPQIQYYGKFLW